MLFVDQILATPKEIKNLPVAVKRVTLVIFVYFISWGLVIPFLPIFFYNVLGSYGAATFVSALATIFSVIWLFPVGEFLDRFSQRKVIRVTLLLYLPIWPFLAVLQTFVHAVIYQLYHSFTATLLWSSAETYTRTHSSHGKRSEAWGLHDVGKAASLLIGAIGGGLLLEYVMDIRMLFVTFPPVFLLGAYALSKYLPKDPKKADLRLMSGLRSIEWKRLYIKEIKDFWSVPALRKIWPFVFVIGFLGASQSVMIPLFAQEAGATYLFIGVLFALFTVPLLLEAPFSVLADTWSARYLVLTGSLIAAASLLGFGLSGDLFVLFPLSLLLGVAVAMLVPSISGEVGNRMTHDKVGEFNSVFMAIGGLGGILGLLTLGPLADVIGVQQIFFVSAGVMFLSCLLAFFTWEPPRKKAGHFIPSEAQGRMVE